MTIDQPSAEEIVAALNKASALCNESLRVIKAHESLGHVSIYGRLVGEFLGHSYTNILAPIWKAYPAIMPPEMNEPYVEPDPALTAESRAALIAFVNEARSALTTVKRLLPTEESVQFLQFGGVPEVEQAVAAIEDFLANPRYREKGSQS
jgi:hypothetical protein